MQTFMPTPDVRLNMCYLDYKRLGKQRVEAYQILQAITGKTKAWLNHPCTQMWIGYENFLKFYINCAIQEWVKRGFSNSMSEYVIDEYDLTPEEVPYWFGGPIHRTHQLMLLKKDYDYYSKYFVASKDVINCAQYYWPTKGKK